MKRIISAMLAMLLCVLIFAGCKEVNRENLSTGTESGSGSSFAESGEASVSESDGESEPTNIKIELDDSFPAYGIESACNKEFAEACFCGYFEPMLLTLWDCGGFSEGVLSADTAFACFEYFVSERRYQIENYDELFLVNGEYSQYYPSEIVEGFLQKHLDISPEELRTLDCYNSELFAYERSYYGGIAKGNTEISSVDFDGESCILSFSFSGYMHSSQELCGFAKMAYEDGTFVLKSLSLD